MDLPSCHSTILSVYNYHSSWLWHMLVILLFTHPDIQGLRGRLQETFHQSIYWLLLYNAILRSRADSLRSHVILHEWTAFYSAFLNIQRSDVPTALAWLVPQESAARESQSRRILCTPYNHAPCHFMQSHICKVYACLAVTCHLRFWHNGQGLLRATAVTRGWNGYWNKSQHRKLTLEKKILPPLQQGFEPATFWSWVRRSSHWAIPAPHIRNNYIIRHMKYIHTMPEVERI